MDDEVVADQWSLYGSPIELRCERFRTLVDDLYEADTYEGPTTHVSVAERQWIVEEALARIDDTDHPLYSEDAPSVGLIEQTEELLTLLEFADAITSTEVEQRLTCEGVPEHGQSLSRFVELVHEVRADAFEDTKTFRSERFRHVLDAGKPLLESELSATDVVVVGSFQTLSPQERDVVGLLADTFDTGVVLTRVTDSDELTGVDDAIRRLSRWYENLGFTGREAINAETSSTREIAAASLYQRDDGTTGPVRIRSGVSLETHATVQGEIREIARSVRSLIGSGVDPSKIAVAPFDDRTYGDRLADALRDADVPVSIRSSRSFFATITGKLFEAVINLGLESDRQAPLVRLLSNPLVAPEQRETIRTVLRNADLLESTRVSILTTHVDTDAEALIRNVVTACERFVNALDVDAERQALFDALGVPTTDDGTSLTEAVAFSRHVREREQQTIDNAIEVCASLTARREATGQDSGEVPNIEAVRRALEQVSVETSIGRRTDSVRVCSPVEAVANSVEYVFVPGLTTVHTPSPPRRLAFARSINDAHPEFEAADPVAGTRYAFAQLVASDADVTFSAPERNPNGDPYVLADPLLELERVTGLEADSVDRRAKPATRADVHRSLATAIDTGALAPPEVASNGDTYDIAIEEANVSDRLAAGVTVASSRAKDEVGEYDGHVDPDVLGTLRGGGGPYSPSRLETYADCGFKYYLKYVLGIEPDEEISLELNALDAGTYVHDVFERFYREWRSHGHERITEDSLEDAEEVLYEVAEDRLLELDARETVFHDTWITALFDGLDVPENRYGDAHAAAGLFKRFLDAEIELAPRDATPTYFEAHVGLTPDEPGPVVISDDPVRVPGTDVSIRGKIDRLDITSDGGLVGMDYKTGSTPSESDSIDGHAFQLSAYLLMAENALGGDPVGASYYQVNPTSSISPHDGTIGGEENATHGYWGKDDPEPLRRYRSLTFDTREEFIEFLHDTVPDRIDRISTAVDNGSFHPTVLDPDTAGCEYCPYREACDVRHHRRHAIHDDLTDANTPQYAPGLDKEGHPMTDNTRGDIDEKLTLTTTQQRAARTIDRNVTVEAGAGTGKTTTLTERYLTILRAHLDGPDSLTAGGDEPEYRVPDDIDRITDPETARRLPERIVVTTFTDRAAEDLKRSIREKIRDRLDEIDDPDRWAVWRATADGVESGYIDTTHGFCSRILEEYAVTHPAVDPDFEVLEANDAARLRTTVANELVEMESSETRVLTPVFDRAKLVDVLTGLIAEHDMTEEWIREIRELEDPEAYEEHLVELHPLDTDPKRLLETVWDDLDTLCTLYSDDGVTDRLGVNPMKRVGYDVLDIYDELTSVDIENTTPIQQLSLCLQLCDALTKDDGSQYGNGTYYGNKSFRESDGPTATRFHEAMDGVLGALQPEARPTDASLDPDREAHKLLTALADLAEVALDAYDDRKRQQGVLDYNDLIRHTLTFLADTGQDAATGLREGLWYVMVDEFQDTNTRQWQLVRALTSGRDPFNADNVGVVGDIKQSIYRFRDADVTVFGTAADAMQEANTANGSTECDPELTTNFRTLPETLRAINGLFDRVFSYGDDGPYEAVSSPLTAGHDTPEEIDPIIEYTPVPVETELRERYLGDDHDLTNLPESEPADIEATAIANRIATPLKGDIHVTDDDTASETETRSLKPEDIAVLIRSRSDLKGYERGLRAANIPYTVIKGEGFFETPEIRALTALLNTLTDPTDDIALYAAARSPLCGLTDTQLAAVHNPDDLLWNSLKTSDDPDIESVVDDIKRWREYAGTKDTPGATVDNWVSLADRILEETGYLAAIAADERGTTALANVDKLRDKLREFDASGVPSLERITARLTNQAEQGQKEPEANDASDSTGVRIMTVHEAKGQEYPVVVVPGLGKEFNDKARISNGSIEYERVPIAGDRRPILGLNVPTDDRTGSDATLMRHIARDRRRAEEHAEEKRILYVAATRAEDHLILTGRHTADDDHDTGIKQPDPNDPSSYRDWIQPALFGTDNAVATWGDLETNGEFTAMLPYDIDDDIEHGTITIRFPPDTEQYDPDPDPVPATTQRSTFTYEQPWEFSLSASDLSRIPAGTVELQQHDDTYRVTATALTYTSDGNHKHDYPDTDDRDIPAAIYGHAVHRLCETRPPTEKRHHVIEQAIREQHDRTPGITETTYPDSAHNAIETAAESAIEYLNDLHANLDVLQTHDEYYIEFTTETGTVSGFIDHLIVTPTAYHVIDYKTDRKPTTQSLNKFLQVQAEHHRQQLFAYAAALTQQDPTRDVVATLYFTDIDEPYTWRSSELTNAVTDTVHCLRTLLNETSVIIDQPTE